MKQQVPLFFTGSLVIIDTIMAGLAFFLGYQLRLRSDYENILPFASFWGMTIVHVAAILTVFFFYRLYHRNHFIQLFILF